MSYKMISQLRICKFYSAALLSMLFLQHTVFSLAPPPVDYLVPPLLTSQPNAAALSRPKPKPSISQNLLVSESRIIPALVSPQLPATPSENNSSLLTRVARWFGFANQNSVADQQSSEGTNKPSYYYPKPQQQRQNGDKEHCYLCNKYPWVPMMPNINQYSQTGNQWDAARPVNLQTYLQQYANNAPIQKPYNGIKSVPQMQQQASSNVRQRAVKFNFPLPYVPPNVNKPQDAANQIQYSTGPFLPIPLPPLLSNSALPPLYNAQNFRSPLSLPPHTIQQLPATEQSHVSENKAEHSEIHVNTAPTEVPSPATASKDASFEIVKSHQLLDYVSSVEYPVSYVPSHSYDVSTQIPPSLLHNPQTNPKVNTVLYQHSTFSPHLSQHVPASQILTEPGNFIAANQQTSSPQPGIYETTALYDNNPPRLPENAPYPKAGDYLAASHQNSSELGEQQPQQTHLDPWTLESNDYVYAASTPDTFYIPEHTTLFTTEAESTTLPPPKDNEVELIASLQTKALHAKGEQNKLRPQNPKQRETPKRLLDSPIQHANGNLGAPRPFTRDPSDLTFRLSPPNHKFPDAKQKAATESPLSSSTFSSIDASGQFAGMVPPSLPSTYNTDQFLIPHLNTKSRPRPFESTRINSVTKSPAAASYSTWSHVQHVELQTPQESMLVNSHIKPAATTNTNTTTTSTPTKPHTTKYLTKVLASNLRELLQREHEPTKLKLGPNTLDIDIAKLQKNIDDWTEQEYSSLSHRPSTPTIHGRSKNIPFEYLPTTTAPLKAARQSKTTKSFLDSSELPSSINNLEPLFERGSTKRYQYIQITDNHLTDFYNNFESMKSKPVTDFKAKSTAATPTTKKSTSTTTTTSTENTLYLRPVPVQEPEELWKNVKVSISPKTLEKVYVVTPQPRFFPQRFYAASALAASTTEKPQTALGRGRAFKSPRFLVRPTPGNDTLSKENSRENASNSYFTSEWFGLRGLSAYVPSEPVEIIDGNSKVLNITTSPSSLEKTTRHNIMDLTKDRQAASKRRTTMAPSPR